MSGRISLMEDSVTVDFRRPGDSTKIFPQPALLSSHNAAWKDIWLEHHTQPSWDTGELTAPTHQVAISLNKKTPSVDRWLDGGFRSETTSYGDCVIIPAGVSHRAQWPNQAEFIVLGIDSFWLERIGQEFGEGPPAELNPGSLIPDPLLQGLLLAFKAELETEGLHSDLYLAQLKTTLGLHLLRNYATRPPKLQEYDGGLSRQQLQQAIDYIQAHLSESIRLSDVATQLNMSQYYFCRLFRQSVGLPPYKYVIRQRVERVKQLLRNDRERAIADIAIDCGFYSQSHLAKHFRQVTGTTPKAYRGK